MGCIEGEVFEKTVITCTKEWSPESQNGGPKTPQTQTSMILG
jgi:hypothetical protein